MKSLWLGVFASSVLVSFAACSSSSSTGGGAAGGSDSGTTANDSGSASGGDSGGGGAPLSCEDDSDHNCVYYASIPKGAETTDCASPSTIVTSCPTTNVVATCAYNSGGTDQLLTWYTGVTANSTALKTTCDSLSGVFTAS